MSDAPIKPIETFYNGYRFRSRLEARWAVFFDSEGWEYTYESEGYDLDGVWYLPDFYLTERQKWVEVKVKYPTDVEQAKFVKLCRLSKQDGLILYGEIHPDIRFLYVRYVPEVDEAIVISDARFDEMRAPSLFKARSTRFEHGEKG
jgi:hypothetical protein